MHTTQEDTVAIDVAPETNTAEFRVQINIAYMEAVLKQASEEFGNMPAEEMYVTLEYIRNHMQTAFGYPEVTFENRAEAANGTAE